MRWGVAMASESGSGGSSPKPPSGGMRRAGRAAAAGTEMVVLFAAGLFLGRYASHRLHAGPWLTAVGVLVGFGAGIWAAYRTLMDS